MTLDEAIKDFTDSAKELRYEANYWRDKGDSKSLEDTLKVAEYNEQLAEWLMELKEAKRLLLLALIDFETIESNLEYDEQCVIKTHSIRCDECPLGAQTIYRCKWRYADEALALIGKDIDVPATEDDTNVGHKQEG